MSNEEVALALTEIAAKTHFIPPLFEDSSLPYDENGVNPKNIEERAAEIVVFYKAALKAISEK